jgi:hypothetical protein
VALAVSDADHRVGEKRLGYLDWDLPDPNRGPLEEVRATRDVIVGRELIGELGRTGGAWPQSRDLRHPHKGGRTAHALTFGRAAVDGHS